MRKPPRLTIAIDWDNTLVTSPNGPWLPGAQDALTYLNNRHNLVIHTCRANWPEGLQAITERLHEHRLTIPIHTTPGKPHAHAYIDDRAIPFTGWPATLHTIHA